jgi:hypothetical protein
MILKSRNPTSIADFTLIEIEGENLKMSRKSRLFVFQTNLPNKIMHCKYRINFSCLLTLGLDNDNDIFLGITLPALLIKTVDLIKTLQTRETIATM